MFFETERGAISIPYPDIKSFRLPKYAPPELQIDDQQTLTTRIVREYKDPTLQIRYKYQDAKEDGSQSAPKKSETQEEQAINLRYGVEGIHWYGQYLLDLDRSELTLNATIVNRLEGVNAKSILCAFGRHPMKSYKKTHDPIVSIISSQQKELETFPTTLEDSELAEPETYSFENSPLKAKTTTTQEIFRCPVPVTKGENHSLDITNNTPFVWAEAQVTLTKNQTICSIQNMPLTRKGALASLHYGMPTTIWKPASSPASILPNF